MASKTFYYARVSTKDQHVDRQINKFKELGANEADIIIDKESGKNLARAGYQYLKQTLLRPGDTLIIHSLDRLSRNKQDIKEEMEYFRKNDIRLKIVDIPTTMMEYPEGQEWVFEMVETILIEVLGSFAENERKQIKKRQAEGIAAAKSRGVQFGRQRIDFPKNWEVVYDRWKAGEIKAVEAMAELDLKKNSFYNLVKRHESKM